MERFFSASLDIRLASSLVDNLIAMYQSMQICRYITCERTEAFNMISQTDA